MVSQCRNLGYYTALRAQRMSTRKKSIRQGAEENVVATLNNAGATTGLPLSPLALSSTSGTAMRKDSTGSNRLDTPKVRSLKWIFKYFYTSTQREALSVLSYRNILLEIPYSCN